MNNQLTVVLCPPIEMTSSNDVLESGSGECKQNPFQKAHSESTYINPTKAQGTKLTAVAGGIVVLVPLKIAGKLAFTSSVSEYKNSTKSYLMYFSMELGYFRVIMKGIMGAIAPMRKK